MQSSFKWAPLVALAVLARPVGAQLGVQTLTHPHSPVKAVSDPTAPAYLYTVGRYGEIRTVFGGAYLPTEDNFATFNVEMFDIDGEGGLLSMALSPNYATDGYVYLSYSRASDRANVIERYQRSASDPRKLDQTTGFTIAVIPNFGIFHYGGNIDFGPDGYLYIGKGDGEFLTSAQNPSLLNGKILRIDPTGDDFPLDPNKNYRIPTDNPFIDGNPIAAAHEIMHFGLRNPWKFSFDDPGRAGTGAMYIGDVGADNWEEINYVAPGDQALNFGWPNREGFETFAPHVPLAYQPRTDPLMAFPHPQFRAIVGGHVYRGTLLGPQYFGRYFYADVISRRVYSAQVTLDPETLAATHTDIVDHTDDLRGTLTNLGNIYSLDVDTDGELVIVSFNFLHRVVRDIPQPVYTLPGSIGFEGLADWADRPKVVTIEFASTEDEVVSYQIGVNENGTFTLPVPAGKVRASIKAGTWLRQAISYDTASLGDTRLDFFLLNGDANDDNAIDIGDFAILSAAFGTDEGDPNFDRMADFNRDRSVDIGDFALLSANFGVEGD